MPRRARDITIAKGVANVVETSGTFDREQRGPSFIHLDQLDIHFRNIRSLVDQLRSSFPVHLRLRVKPSAQRAGSGRYAVTSTAGPALDPGIPHR